MLNYLLNLMCTLDESQWPINVALTASVGVFGRSCWNYAKALLSMPKDPMASFIKTLRMHGTTVLYCDEATRFIMPMAIQPRQIEVHALPSLTTTLFAAAALHDVT